ncbi:MAG: transposase, partial [Firmicutes bacterium]|nr:transposase [Bacillota bacterium]
ENLKYNNLYRWFIGYELNEKVPDHSTYSQNYKRKFCKLEKDLLQTVFDKVIDLLINWNCLDMTAVYIDSTHTKAYANKKKHHKETVKIEAKKYQKELDLEIALKVYKKKI